MSKNCPSIHFSSFHLGWAVFCAQSGKTAFQRGKRVPREDRRRLQAAGSARRMRRPQCLWISPASLNYYVIAHCLSSSENFLVFCAMWSENGWSLHNYFSICRNKLTRKSSHFFSIFFASTSWEWSLGEPIPSAGIKLTCDLTCICEK